MRSADRRGSRGGVCSSVRLTRRSFEITAQRACESDVYAADIHVRTAECLRSAVGDAIVLCEPQNAIDDEEAFLVE